MKHDGICNTLRAFKLLLDGRWHHVDELKKKCGADGTKRARELREKRWGGWAVQIARGEEIESQRIPRGKRTSNWYRLDPEDLEQRKGQAALLASGQNIFAVDAAEAAKETNPFDEKVKIDLTVANAVFLFALANNMAELCDPRTKPQWDQQFSICRVKLLEAIEATSGRALKPTDIFNPEDHE